MKAIRSSAAIVAAAALGLVCSVSHGDVYIMHSLSRPLQKTFSFSWEYVDGNGVFTNLGGVSGGEGGTVSDELTNTYAFSSFDLGYGGSAEISEIWNPVLPAVPANGEEVPDSASVVLTGTWFGQADHEFNAFGHASVSPFHLADLIDASHGQEGDSVWATYPTGGTSTITFGGAGTNSSSGDLIHGFFKPGANGYDNAGGSDSSLTVTVAMQMDCITSGQSFGAIQSFNFGAYWQRIIHLLPPVELRASSIGTNGGTGGLYFTDSHGGTDTATPSTVTTSGAVSTSTVAFARSGGATLAGPGTIAMTGSTQTIDSNTGSNFITAQVTASGTLNLNAASGSSIKFTQPLGLASGTNVVFSGYSLGATGGSLIELKPFIASDVTIAGMTVKLTAVEGTLVVDHLEFVPDYNPDSPGSATLDIGDNYIIIHNQIDGNHEASYEAILALVVAGYDGGAWDGPGITSSLLGLGNVGTLEVIDNYGYGGDPVYTTWGGVTVGANDVLIAYVISVESAAVPEPASIASLVFLGSIALNRRHRRA